MKYEILKRLADFDGRVVDEQLILAARLEGAVSVFAAAASEIRAERPRGQVILFDHREDINIVTQKPEWRRVPILGYEKGKVNDERQKAQG